MKVFKNGDLTRERNVKELERDFKTWLWVELAVFLVIPILIIFVSYLAAYFDSLNPLYMGVGTMLATLAVMGWIIKKKV